MDDGPLSVRGLDHLLLLVRGMERAVGFYEGVLGCTVKTRLPQFAMVELRAGDSDLDLVDIADPAGAWARPAAEGGRNIDHFCLRVEAAEPRLRSHLAEHAVEIVEERLEAGCLSLYCKDPSGNVVELKFPV
jgi:glyoxylase I family protein